MSDDQQDPMSESEVERLRAENAALRTELDGKRERGGGRRWVSVVLAVLAAILVPVSALTVWTHRTLLDTDQYVDTVGPLARNEAVQNRVAEVLSEEIKTQVDFEGLLNQTIEEANLPEGLGRLVGPLAGGAEAIVERVVSELVRSEAFANFWEEANRKGHEVVVAVLTGEGGDLIETDSGQIRLTFDTLLLEVGNRLESILGTDLISRVGLDQLEPEVVLIESEDLARAQDLVDLLDTLAWLIPLITLGLLLLTVVVAHDRRRGVRRAGLAILLSSLLALGLLAVARGRIVGAAQDEDAARAVVEQLLRFLVMQFRVLVVLGGVVLFAAWIVGPARSAVRARAWGTSMIGRVATVEDAEEVGAAPIFVARHRTGLLAAVLLLGGLVLLLADRPTGWTVLLIALFAGAIVVVIEAVARVGRMASDVLDTGSPDSMARAAAEPSTT